MAFISSFSGVSIVSFDVKNQSVCAFGASPRTSISSKVPQTKPVCMAATSKPSRRAALSLFPAAALFLISRKTLADHTVVAARRSFDRYHPRILNAIETMKNIGVAVGKNDAEGAAALVNDKLFSVKGRRAFSIYATSFSDNYLGPQSRAMLKAVDGMYLELEQVAAGADMSEHFDAAVDKLEAYYTAARLPNIELSGLRKK